MGMIIPILGMIATPYGLPAGLWQGWAEQPAICADGFAQHQARDTQPIKDPHLGEVGCHGLTGHHQDQPAPPTLGRRVVGRPNDLADGFVKLLLRLTR